MSGDVDLVVCDGFTGNIILKTIEGVGNFVKIKMSKSLFGSLKDKLKLIFAKKNFMKLKHEIDYRRFGGGIFLGVKKCLVKAHGSSDEKSFYYTLKQAEKYAESGVLEKIEKEIIKTIESRDN